MTQEISHVIGSWFPLLFLTVFGFVGLLWSTMLMVMMVNVVRQFGPMRPRQSARDHRQTKQDEQVASKERRISRVHVASTPMPQAGQAAATRDSLPPFVSLN